MRRRISLGVALAVTLVLGSAWGQGDKSGAAKSKNNPPVAQTPAQPTSESNSASYIIGAEDTLHVSVWKEPDLSATLPVRPDGKISMPLLDDVQAAGLTPMQLAESVTEKLKRYISDPRVTVVVTAMNSQRVFVMGEVTHGGSVQLVSGMTVLQALSSAGFTQFANTKKIYVLRLENGKQTKLPVNYNQIIKGAMEQNVVLKPGDTIVVP
jgi:polysaccharide biosynthesis/export protein